jgi:tetratricopeptide (TPR) repeat protein
MNHPMRSDLSAILLFLGFVGVAPGPLRADEAAEAFKEGRRLLQRQKPREAVALFRKALQLDPCYPQAATRLGDALFQLSRYEEALCAYHLSLKSDAPDACYPAYLGLGRVLLAMNPVPKKDENLRQAISSFNQAIALDPKVPAAYFYRGGAYHRLRELDKALADYSRAIELDPQHADAHEQRSHVWRDKGEKTRAEADYAKARQLRQRTR